ncbi:MAG: hypothetical protein JNG89_13890 [Planctomycetaceae bacterium]|nr:hypothetical protein [Planctomycetaceae bacterium]
MHCSTLGRCALVAAWMLPIAGALAADDYDQPPISYSTAEPHNTVEVVRQQLDAGAAALAYDDDFGYLPSLLNALHVPVESQMFVYSQTSLQRGRISPRTPRAIYFNDDVYIGYCHRGGIIEISAVDPQLGAVFYTLGQRESSSPALVRHNDNCLTCHSTSRTGNVPGHLVRSLYVDDSGLPLLDRASYVVNHTTPIKDRWGGWYVTGTHDAQSHMGNLILSEGQATAAADDAGDRQVTEPGELVLPEHYLTTYSDVVALMVLDHQTFVHNRLTQASFETRQALDDEATIGQASDRPDGRLSEVATSRIASAGDDLVDALLLVNEAPLSTPLRGTSGFAEVFVQQGPHDARGRSLREFDLNTRTFRYPCSYLIYSKSFDALPSEMRDYVWQRLWSVLAGEDTAEKFAHLSENDRQAIREILQDTKPGIPAYWE